MSGCLQAEKSIIKKYRREIWKKFLSAIDAYGLIREGDRIAVCMSGGKDSMLMAKCMQQLHRYSRFSFDAVYLVMDPGYNALNRQMIEENAEFLDIPVQIFPAPIFDYVAKLDKYPCYICARMRRGYLYKQARELGCNKIALGHHFDDVIETVLMSMFYNGEFRTMMPKLRSTNWEGMELIRPMYRVKERDIVAWRQYNGLQFNQCACRLTENCVLDDGGMGSKRQEIKQLIRKLRQANPSIDSNIFGSIHDVNLDTVIGYHFNGQKHGFEESYAQNARVEDAENEPE
jgi:Predicted ATPase of the PP-loop superfamily implicated in cell cycle control